MGKQLLSFCYLVLACFLSSLFYLYRGWFEDEDDFQARCAYEAVKAKAKFEGSSKKKAAGATSSKGETTRIFAGVLQSTGNI